MEPFHLKREREEGYFDESGTYVEYKTDDVEDNWADSLAGESDFRGCFVWICCYGPCPSLAPLFLRPLPFPGPCVSLAPVNRIEFNNDMGW
jgi:hypothetical protein